MSASFSDIDQASLAIELFAECCEGLNDFSRQLSKYHRFGKVTTSSDIRKYLSGWRLEKYVEAEILSNSDQVVAWCVELGRREAVWVVMASVSISHGNFHLDLVERNASSFEELQIALHDVSLAVYASIKDEAPLSVAIDELKKE